MPNFCAKNTHKLYTPVYFASGINIHIISRYLYWFNVFNSIRVTVQCACRSVVERISTNTSFFVFKAVANPPY